MFNLEEYTEKAANVMMSTQDILSRYGQDQLRSEHILLALIEDEENAAIDALKNLKVNIAKLKDKTEDLVKEYGGSQVSSGGIKQMYITPDARHVLESAKSEATRMGDEKIGTEHLLLGMVKTPDSMAARVLLRFGVSDEKVYNAILSIRKSGKSKESENLDALAKFTVDLTQQAKEGKLDPVIGREEEIERMIEILGRKRKNNPVLIGDPGVGKTAIVEGLAQLVVSGKVPDYMMNKRILSLDMGRLVAGTKFRGEFEERLKSLIDAVKGNSNVILFIDELHTVVGAGSVEGGSLDASNMLKPALARGELRCIGATTLEDYRKYIEKDKALARRFQTIDVKEPSEEETIKILLGLKDSYESHHGVKIENEAIETAVKLSSRYISDRFLPDKAIDLIDEAASRVKFENSFVPSEILEGQNKISALEEEINDAALSGDYEKAAMKKAELEKIKKEFAKIQEEWKKRQEKIPKVVNSDVIAKVVERWTGIPVTKLMEDERNKLANLEELIHKRIVDQEEAVRVVSSTIRRARAGLKDPNRPMGTFLFVGPTGVGKTETAKALAEVLFNSENAMIRIDMSEYSEKHTVSRLIGAPPGYVGYEEGGQLTEAVRRRPYSVILLDEIEKAHPEIFNTLLQVLDDGRLTDGKGNTVDFRNTVIIMTSNIGSDYILESVESGKMDYLDEGMIQELRKYFKPEFLNRIDAMIAFRPLGKSHMESIVEKFISKIRANLADKNITLEITKNAIEYLAEKGYDPAFGARPLRRLIEFEVEDKIADMIISKELSEGDKVIVDEEDGILSVSKSPATVK
ncbi:ATP-dependent Clp protease ATP-binding subunit [Athalassotoga saccharophila]|uniref:ATP-dependent Clp protease ATP-binding subunit n=1 Tax=Athalassotoga saccharophila TaxID=1441386 RepID=UPI00137AE5FF|nr:ATP-dependent Clp protease ATP-binding subunit [Athalassotoga saccharophila]BBJ27607.1 ATP-dependent Clp protease ATP-binding subunit ClpC [Athalassotoga saccharophila]